MTFYVTAAVAWTLLAYFYFVRVPSSIRSAEETAKRVPIMQVRQLEKAEGLQQVRSALFVLLVAVSIGVVTVALSHPDVAIEAGEDQSRAKK